MDKTNRAAARRFRRELQPLLPPDWIQTFVRHHPDYTPDARRERLRNIHKGLVYPTAVEIRAICRTFSLQYPSPTVNQPNPQTAFLSELNRLCAGDNKLYDSMVTLSHRSHVDFATQVAGDALEHWGRRLVSEAQAVELSAPYPYEVGMEPDPAAPLAA